jgi:hypothetical protein
MMRACGRLPGKYCIKRSYGRAKRMEKRFFQSKREGARRAGKEKILDMANKKRNNGQASR